MSIGTEVFIKLLAEVDPNLKPKIDAMLAEMERLNQASSPGSAAPSGPSPVVQQVAADTQAQVALFNDLAEQFKRVQAGMSQVALTGAKDQMEAATAAINFIKAQDEQLTAEVIKNAAIRRQAREQEKQPSSDRMNDRLDVGTAQAQGDKEKVIALRADQMVAAAQRVGAEEAKVDAFREASRDRIVRSIIDANAKEEAAQQRKIANERVLSAIVDLRYAKANGTPDDVKFSQSNLNAAMLERRGVQQSEAAAIRKAELDKIERDAKESADRVTAIRVQAEQQVNAQLARLAGDATAIKKQRLEEEIAAFRAKGVSEQQLAKLHAERLREIEESVKAKPRTLEQASGTGKTPAEEAAERAAEAAEKAAAKTKQALSDLHTQAMNTGIAFAAIAVPLGFLGREMLQQVRNFDVYRVKLQTVMHDTVAAEVEVQKAVTMAMRTPFDVASVVDASAKLRVFRQDADKLLPLAGDLAAAMGKDINEAALALGKAMEGSASGVRELTNTFGISRVQLKEHGAEITKHGQILLQNRQQIDKFRQAVMGIITENYGGGMERLMATLTGSLTNLGDVWHNTWRKMGEQMEPTAIAVVKTATEWISWFGKMPSVMSAGVGMIISTGTALASVGVASSGAIALLTRLGASFPALGALAQVLTADIGHVAVQMGAAGITSTALSGNLAVLKSAMWAFATNPMVLAITAIVAAGALAIKMVADWEDREVKHGLLIAEQSHALKRAEAGWKEYGAILDEIAGKTGNAANQTGRLANETLRLIAARNATPAQVAEVLGKYGKTAEDVTREGQQARKDLEPLTRRQAALAPFLQQIQQGNYQPTDQINLYPGVNGATAEQANETRTQLGGRVGVSVQDVLTYSNMLNRNIAALQNIASTAETIGPPAHKDDTLRADISEGEKGAQRYTKYDNTSLPGAATRQEQLGRLRETAASMSGALTREGLPTDVKSAQEYLLNDSRDNPGLQAHQKAVQSYLDVLHKIAQEEKKIEADREAAQKQKFQDLQAHYQQLGALGQEDLNSKVARLQREIGLMTGTDKESHAERLTLRRELASAELALDKERTDALLHNADETRKDEIADAQGGLQATLQAYYRHYWTLEADLKKHGAHKKEILEAQRQDRIAIHKAEQDDAKKHEETLAKQAIDASNRRIIAAEKNPDLSSDAQIGVIMAELQKSRDALYRMRARGLSDTNPMVVAQQKNIEDDLLKIEERRDAQRKAALADEKSILAVRKTSLDHEIQALRERMKAGEVTTKLGENIEQKLADDIRKRLALELAEIDRAANEKRKTMEATAENEKRITEEVARKKEAAIESELKSVKEVQAERAKVENETQKNTAAVHARYDSSRSGGAMSPVYSAQERSDLAAAQGGKEQGRLGRFSLPEFTLTLSDRKDGQKPAGDPLTVLATQLQTSFTALDQGLQNMTNKNVNAMQSLEQALKAAADAFGGKDGKDKPKGGGGGSSADKPTGEGGVGGTGGGQVGTRAFTDIVNSLGIYDRSSASQPPTSWFNNPDNFLAAPQPPASPAFPEGQGRFGTGAVYQNSTTNATIQIGGRTGLPLTPEEAYHAEGLSNAMDRRRMSPNDGILPTYDQE